MAGTVCCGWLSELVEKGKGDAGFQAAASIKSIQLPR